jgi:hypothetical protein
LKPFPPQFINNGIKDIDSLVRGSLKYVWYKSLFMTSIVKRWRLLGQESTTDLTAKSTPILMHVIDHL